MKNRIVFLLLALCFILSMLNVSAFADYDPSTMTWSAYQALSASEKTAFYKTFASAAEFNAWRKAAQDAEKPDSIVIGTGTNIPISTPHLHCVCGGSCSLGGHTHEEHTWTPVNQSNLDTLTQVFNDGTVHYFTLLGNVTTTLPITVGDDSGAASVYLDLNGFSLTSGADCVFDVNNGSAAVCDCQGTGSILVNPSNVVHASFVTFENAVLSAENLTFSMFGGTISYANTAAASTRGLIYCLNNGSVFVYGGTLNGAGKTSGIGGGLLTADSDAQQVCLYGGSFLNGSSAVSGGAVYCAAQLFYDSQTVVFDGNVAPSGETVFTILSPLSEMEVVGEELPAGMKMDLKGGTLKISGQTVLDLTVCSSVDGGLLEFDEDMPDEDVAAIVTAIAQNNLKLPKSEQCLPLKSGEKTYTVCKLQDSGGMWCPTPQAVDDADGTYKIRMMPRFASTTAYDILRNASEDDMLTIGFSISAKYYDNDALIYRNGSSATSLNCDFSYANAQTFFAAAKDSRVFFVQLAGIEEGMKITVNPYIKINGQIVYQGTSGTEHAVLDLTM